MLQFLKLNKHKIWFVLFILSIIPLILSKVISPAEPAGRNNEKFNADLHRLKTVDDIISYTDSTYGEKELGNSEDTANYVVHLTEVVKDRFYHGELNYTFPENWLAWVAGKTIWSHFSSMVLTNDILKHSRSLCNQQTMVYMEALLKKGIDVRSVGLGYKVPGHFLSEVWYGGSWHLFDISVEPDWSQLEHPHMSLEYYLLDKEMFYKIYAKRMPRDLFDKIMEQHVYGERNDLPAKKMKFFQRVTLYSTYLLPMLLALLSFVSYRRKKEFKIHASAENQASFKSMKEGINQ